MGSSPTKLSLLQTKNSQLPHVFIRNARKKIKKRPYIASSLLVTGLVVSSGQSRWGKIRMNKLKRSCNDFKTANSQRLSRNQINALGPPP